jgi:hypothetical protein
MYLRRAVAKNRALSLSRSAQLRAHSGLDPKLFDDRPPFLGIGFPKGT